MADLKVAHIWAARFKSDDEQEEIFEELEWRGNDQEPITLFAKSQNELFYDHDFFYISKKGDFLSDNSIQGASRAAIVDKLSELLCNDYDSLIVGDEEDFKSPKSCTINNSEVVYLGKYNHW